MDLLAVVNIYCKKDAHSRPIQYISKIRAKKMKNQQIQPQIKFQSSPQSPTPQSQPWLRPQTRSIPNPIIRFHNQIIDFSTYIEASAEQHQTKLNLCLSLQAHLKTHLTQISVYWPFVAHRMYLKGTELELFVVLEGENWEWEGACWGAVAKVAEGLGLKVFQLSSQVSATQCFFILEDEASKTEIWIRFFPPPWKLFISQIDKAVSSSIQIKYLYLIVSCMIRQRSFHTSIKSLLIYGLCSFFAYQRRRQKVRTLTQNMLKFLQLFTIYNTQQKQRKIQYREGNIYSHTMSNDRTFIFEIAPKVDLAAGKKTKDLFKILQNRYRVLSNYYYPPNTSILIHLINPCSGKFFY